MSSTSPVRRSQSGRWLQVREGVRGVPVHDGDRLHVHVLLEPVMHYYRTMTRSTWIPVLISEVI